MEDNIQARKSAGVTLLQGLSMIPYQCVKCLGYRPHRAF